MSLFLRSIPRLKKDMLALVKRTAQEQGTTVVMVTHHPDDAQAIASQFIYLDNGQIQLHDTVNVLSEPPTVMRDYIGVTG